MTERGRERWRIRSMKGRGTDWTGKRKKEIQNAGT